MKPQNKYLILFCLVFLLLFVLIKPSSHNSVELPKTITDTIYRIDTFMYEKPVPKDSFIRDTFFLPIIIDKDSLLNDSIKKDTIYAELAIEEKTYEDSTYFVKISGFKPRLEEIKVFPKTYYIEKTNVVEKKNFITWGIQCGVGYGVINKKPDIFLGIGVQFNF